MADSIKATPRNEALAWLADKLRGARDVGDVVQVPVLGGLGSMFLGKAPEELTEWSYGNAPMTVPEMTRVPQFKRGRADSLTDLVFAAQGASPLAKIADRGAMAAGRAGERLAERVVPQVMERGGIGAQLMQDMATGSRSKIFSLRDKKGQPHVTIEVAPGVENPSITESNFRGRPTFVVNNQGNGFPTLEEAQEYARKISTPEIVQIKGKANRAPNPEYLPAVQDFVRSGNWSKVGDLKNTGLVDLQQMGVPDAMRGGQRFVTEDEYKDIVRKNAEGFAEGGLVGGAHSKSFDVSNLAQSIAKLAKEYDITPSDVAAAFGKRVGIPLSAALYSGELGPQEDLALRARRMREPTVDKASGGLVDSSSVVANSATTDFDPARIDSIVGELHAMNAG